MNEIISSAMIGLSNAKAGVQKSADNIANSIKDVEKVRGVGTEDGAGVDVGDVKEVDRFANTDLAGDVVNMIISARSYEFNLKSVEAWSEMTKSAIDMVDDK